MKIRVGRDNLHAALRIAKRTSRTQMPAHDTILLRADDGMLELVAAGMEETVFLPVDAELLSSGTAAVNLKQLAKLVLKSKNTDAFTISADGTTVTITADTLSVELAAFDVGKWPQLPERTPAASEHPIESLAAVHAFRSTDVARPVLTHLQFDNDAVAATDSYRLGAADLDVGVEALVNGDVIKQLLASKPDRFGVGVSGDGEWVTLHDPDTGRSWVSVAEPGEFPKFRKLLPPKRAAYNTVTADSKVVQNAVQKMSAAVDVTSNIPCVLKVDGDAVVLSVSVTGVASVRVELPDAQVDGEFCPFASNPRYLADCAKALGGNVTIGQRAGDTAALKPHLMTSDLLPEVRAILMPMRLND